MNRNILLDRHPHLRETWSDLSKMLGVCKDLMSKKGIDTITAPKVEEWTDYIKINFGIIMEACTNLGWESSIPPIEDHPNYHIQLYIDAISMIGDLESMIKFINSPDIKH